jgi:glycerophosphoryl diester phosphodiesterase
LTHALQGFWRALPDFLYYDLIYRVLAVILVTPLVLWLFHRFVARSGSEAIGNFDIGLFLLTPMGAAMTGLILVVLGTITFARLAGLIHIGSAVAADRRVTYADALRMALVERPTRVMKVSFLVLFVLLIVALPFVLAILFAAWMLVTEHDINYYLTTHPPEFLLAIGIAAVIAMVGAIALVLASAPLVFALPQALYSHHSIRTVFHDSRRLAKGQLTRIASVIAVCVVATVVASSMANGIVYFIGSLLVQAAGERVGLLVAALGGTAALNVLLNVLIDFTSVSVLCLVIARLYRQARERLGWETPAPLSQATPLSRKPEWKLHRKAPLAVAILALVLTSVVVHQIMENLNFVDRVDITAHRGASLAAPENTLSAIRQAIAKGATYVEFDVQLTADGSIVVNHDADLMRVARSPLVISQATFEELREVDVGTPFGAKFAGERLPTLDEVIEAAEGKVKLVVEFKSYKADAAKLVAEVVKTIKDRDLVEGAVVMSLKYDEVREVERLAPEIVSGFVASATLGDLSKLHADFLAVSKSQASDAFIATAHAQGKEVYVWTIDDPGDMSTMIDRGVDNIITNDPATAVRVLKERAELGTAERILLRFKSLYGR